MAPPHARTAQQLPRHQRRHEPVCKVGVAQARAVAQLERDYAKERDEQAIDKGEAQHVGQECRCAEPDSL